MDGFELPESDELIVALHLGGSRKVRAVTDKGLSRSCSTPGLLTILPPGRSAAFRTEGSISLVSLHVPKSLAAEMSLPVTATPDQPWLPRFAFRDPYVSASLEALLRTARSGQAIRPDYMVKVVDAMLCHLAQWRQTSEDAGPLPGAAADQLLLLSATFLVVAVLLDGAWALLASRLAAKEEGLRILTGQEASSVPAYLRRKPLQGKADL